MSLHPPSSSPLPLRWGVIGPGRIAQRFARALATLPGARLAAVTGRNPAHAAAFARQWGVAATLHASADALAADPEVDAVYVATPHTGHAGAVRSCLLADKPVLCEKPLAPTAAQAEALLALARERGVFLMEAVWTRLLPAWAQARQWLDSGAIGRVRALHSSFCFAVPYDPASRLFDPALAGGTLLDIGIYNLSLSQWLMRREPASFEIAGVLSPGGVDRQVEAVLHYAGGETSSFTCAFDRDAANEFVIEGSAGRIVVERGFWEATALRLELPVGPAQRVERPLACNGFEYETLEAMRCIAAGALESPAIPHADTLATLRLIDAMRARLGVRYPFE
jgi:predicted dehydrogenase